ncbi:FlgO family outer membrane protein [Spirosoma litoris]
MKPLQTLFLLLFLFCSGYSQAQDSDIDTKMQKMATQLAERIRATGKNRVGVADFNDLQGNVPELGKYLAENFQGELVNNKLRVINRQRLSDLLNENKLTAQKLLDPANALIIGKAAGMEVIVTGTIAPIDEHTVAINVLALDIQGAEAIASAKTKLNRTVAINDLMRSTVKQGGGSGSLQEVSTMPTVTSQDKNIGYVLMGDKTLDLSKETCLSGHNYGQVCLENILKQPLVLYQANGRHTYYPNILIGTNARNCAPLFLTNTNNKVENTNYDLFFHTTEEDEASRRYGKISIVIEGCKVITRVINTDRLFLSKTKPK